MNTLFHPATANHSLVTALVPASAARLPRQPDTRSTLQALRLNGPGAPNPRAVNDGRPASRDRTTAGAGLLPRPQAAELAYAAASVLLPFLLAAALLLG